MRNYSIVVGAVAAVVLGAAGAHAEAPADDAPIEGRAPAVRAERSANLKVASCAKGRMDCATRESAEADTERQVAAVNVNHILGGSSPALHPANREKNPFDQTRVNAIRTATLGMHIVNPGAVSPKFLRRNYTDGRDAPGGRYGLKGVHVAEPKVGP